MGGFVQRGGDGFLGCYGLSSCLRLSIKRWVPIWHDWRHISDDPFALSLSKGCSQRAPWLRQAQPERLRKMCLRHVPDQAKTLQKATRRPRTGARCSATQFHKKAPAEISAGALDTHFRSIQRLVRMIKLPEQLKGECQRSCGPDTARDLTAPMPTAAPKRLARRSATLSRRV